MAAQAGGAAGVIEMGCGVLKFTQPKRRQDACGTSSIDNRHDKADNKSMAVSAQFEKMLQRLKAGDVLLCDGAWGTQMQKLGLQAGDCPEEWNVSKPDAIRQIAREYFEAGVDFCLTNTFGANRYRLIRNGITDELAEFNRAGVRLSLEAAKSFGGVVAASVGPTGEYVEPQGMVSRTEMYNAYKEQIEALKEGGADAIVIETMYVLEETLLAIKAAKDCGMFCMACMTFDSSPQGYRCLDASLQDSARALDASGADVIGTNCGNGIVEMVEIAALMRPLTSKPLMVKSNAGLPLLAGGKATYKETPEVMASFVPQLIKAGVSIVGGCCGTTPEYIRAFRREIDAIKR